MRSVKENDCFICAVAEVEGVNWKQAKRRTRRVRKSKNTLGVSTWLLYEKGLPGFEEVCGREHKDLCHAFRFRPGILLLQNGPSHGHALAWNGWKLICNCEGWYHGMTNENFTLRGDDKLVTGLMKKDVSLFETLKNRVMRLILKVPSRRASK